VATRLDIERITLVKDTIEGINKGMAQAQMIGAMLVVDPRGMMAVQ
jgi:hypothetical protein